MEVDRSRAAPGGLPPPPKHVKATVTPDDHPLSLHKHQVSQHVVAERMPIQVENRLTHRVSPPTTPPAELEARPLGVIDGKAQQARLEKPWASFEDNKQAEMVQHVQEVKPHWHVPDFIKGGDSSSAKYDTSSISSEAESVDDVWSISHEQQEYYTNQFLTMQPDLNSVISGPVAKDFFEKSKLPVHELSRIWQLSDVNRDGALSLEEFCTAMHLVVLRRNDIELPDSLPPSLIPYVPFMKSDEPFAADLPPGSTLKRLTPPSPHQWQSGLASIPVESPASSSMSSPGVKQAPVNFEVQPVMADPESKIVQPKALKMSPDVMPGDKHSSDRSAEEGGATASSSEEGPSPPPNKLRSDSLGDIQGLCSRPRPTPKKAPAVMGPDMVASRLIQPPPQSGLLEHPAERPSTLPVRDAGLPQGLAPPPPPRHAATSEDHDRLSSHAPAQDAVDDRDGAPPAIPPRPGNREEGNLDENLVSQRGVERVGAAERLPTNSLDAPPKDYQRSVSLDFSAVGTSMLYSIDGESSLKRKQMQNRRYSAEELSPEGTRGPLPRAPSLDRKDIQAAVRWQKERNRVLSQLNNELNQELQEVMEQRIALEIQLEHLKPYSS